MICRILSHSWMLNVTIWIFILLCKSVTSQKDGGKQTQNVPTSHTGALNDMRSILDKAVSNNSAVFNVRQLISANNASAPLIPSTRVSNMKTATWSLSGINNSNLGSQPVVLQTVGNTNNQTTSTANTKSDKPLTNTDKSHKKDKVAAFSWSSYSKGNKTAFYIPLNLLSRRKRQAPNVDTRRNRRVLLLMNPNQAANQTVRLNGRNMHMLVRHNGTGRLSPTFSNTFSQQMSQGSMPSTGLLHSNQITKVQEVSGQPQSAILKPAIQSIGNLDRINLGHSLTSANVTKNKQNKSSQNQRRNVTRVTRQSPRRFSGSINLINPSPRQSVQSVRNQTGNIRQTHPQVGPIHNQRSSGIRDSGRIINFQQGSPSRTPVSHSRSGPRIQQLPFQPRAPLQPSGTQHQPRAHIQPPGTQHQPRAHIQPPGTQHQPRAHIQPPGTQHQPRVPLQPSGTQHAPSRVIPVVTRRQGNINSRPVLRPNVEAQLAHQQPVSSRRIPQPGTISQQRPSWQRPSRPLVTRISAANLRRQRQRFDPRARPVPTRNIGHLRRRPISSRMPRRQMIRRRRPPDPFTRRFAAGFQRGSNLLIQPPMDFTGFDGTVRENVGFAGGPGIGAGVPGLAGPGIPPFGGMPPGFPPMFPGLGPGLGPPGPFMFR